MKRSARKFQVKAKRLLKLYSLWHETRRQELERQCERLLSEILDIDPGFSLRREFQTAF